METVTKKQFKHKNNTVAVKVEKNDDDIMEMYYVTVICAKGKKRVKGLLTCKKSGIKAAIKRLIRFSLIDQPLGSKY